MDWMRLKPYAPPAVTGILKRHERSLVTQA
jgi:hypothetical protein